MKFVLSLVHFYMPILFFLAVSYLLAVLSRGILVMENIVMMVPVFRQMKDLLDC